MKYFIFVTMLLSSPLTRAQLCEWDLRTGLGFMDPKISEASGLAISTLKEELYHVNDSIDTGLPFIANVHVTDYKGKILRNVLIERFKVEDTEEIRVGACPQEQSSCVFVGDIGDNDWGRDYIQVAVVRETDMAKTKAKPLNVVRITYPEGPQDAEGMSVHPNGDLFILTKFGGRSRIYRVPKAQMAGKKAKAILVGTIYYKKLATKPEKPGMPIDEEFATSMDISPDGKSFAVLTYNDIIEYPIDLSNLNGQQQKTVQKGEGVPLKALRLGQQEALAYKGVRRIFYNSENEPQIRQMVCKGERRTSYDVEPTPPVEPEEEETGAGTGSR